MPGETYRDGQRGVFLHEGSDARVDASKAALQTSFLQQRNQAELEKSDVLGVDRKSDPLDDDRVEAENVLHSVEITGIGAKLTQDILKNASNCVPFSWKFPVNTMDLSANLVPFPSIK